MLHRLFQAFEIVVHRVLSLGRSRSRALLPALRETDGGSAELVEIDRLPHVGVEALGRAGRELLLPPCDRETWRLRAARLTAQPLHEVEASAVGKLHVA